MPSIQVPAASADLSADGSTAGYVQVASNAPFYPGAKGWLENSAGSKRILIVGLSGTDKIFVRFIRDVNDAQSLPSPNYGYSDVSSFTLATSSRIYQEAGLAPIDPAYTKKISVP